MRRQQRAAAGVLLLRSKFWVCRGPQEEDGHKKSKINRHGKSSVFACVAVRALRHDAMLRLARVWPVMSLRQESATLA